MLSLRLRTAVLLAVLSGAVALPTIVQGADAGLLGRSLAEWKQSLDSKNDGQRIEAAWAIAQMASKKSPAADRLAVLAALKELTTDRDPSVRYWGALGLSQYGQQLASADESRRAIDDALLPLLKDQAAAPRLAAAEALCTLGKADVALPVLVAGMSDPIEAVRIQAATSLETLGPTARPAQSVLEKAKTDSSEYVKNIAARAAAALEASGK
jgi:hypothetical protein